MIVKINKKRKKKENFTIYNNNKVKLNNHNKINNYYNSNNLLIYSNINNRK